MALLKARRRARNKPARKKPDGLLRFAVCGALEGGKSTLIGCLLAETGSLSKDQLAALASRPKRSGRIRGGADHALPADGPDAGRERSDTSWHDFRIGKRAFAAADTPGHERHTRDMVAAASSADAAVLLVDARAGVTAQVMRQSRILALLGIRDIALVVNKMDLVHFSEKAFDAAVLAYREFAASLGTLNVTPIPAAARSGENVMARSKKMRWFRGPSVAEYLEAVVPRAAGALRIPVQRISGEGRDFRGFAGTVASGSIARGDNARIARSGLSSRVARIVAADGGDIERAKAGDAVTIVFSDHLDVSRGDLIADPERGPEVSDQFAAHVVWFEETPLLPGRSYSLRMGTQTVTATVTTLKHKVELATGAEEAGHNLAMNEIGFCNVATIEPVAFDACGDNRATGAFVLTDRLSGKTVGAGMVAFALRRASNIRHQHYEVDKRARSALKSQRPCIVWFTGLPSAGKSTVMNLVEQRLHRQGAHTYSLDGDNLRGGLTRDLGFTDADRVENIRRAGEVAKLMVDAGLVVLCAFVSPFRAERRMVRELVGEGEFVEVFVDTPIETCIERDPKGLYRKAREGKVFHVTGIDSPYEPPERPEIHLRPAAGRDAAEQADAVFAELIRRGITA